jgi:hypothetical protein
METNYVNTGLISQNYDVINQVNQKYGGSTVKDLDQKSSGTMTAISEDELKTIQQKQKNESKTLNVDSSEIINNIYSKTGNNITYNVEGVSFTNEEMKACKEIVKNAIAELPTKGSDLNYKDYATMGIASNIVNSYAEQNLTDEQASIVNKSLADYFDSLVNAEKERQQASGYFTDDTDGIGNTGELNKYYNVRSNGISNEAAESLKAQMANLPTQSRNTLLSNLESAVKSGYVQSASNTEYAETIKNLFQTANLDDEDSVSNVLKQYSSLMMPVYKAYGLQNTANDMSLNHVLERDTNNFQICISNLKAVAANIGNRVSYSV